MGATRSVRASGASRVACCAGVMLCAWCVAQTGSGPVDQGVADRHPLAESQRNVGLDLRAPMQFEQLYRLDPRSRLLSNVRGWRGGGFARVQGGLIAVFPRSAYRPIAPGIEQVQIPPGTIYTLGDATRMADPAPKRAPRESLSLVQRVEHEPVVQGPARQVPDEERVHASIWVSEEYRARRVGALLDKAFHAEP